MLRDGIHSLQLLHRVFTTLSGTQTEASGSLLQWCVLRLDVHIDYLRWVKLATYNTVGDPATTRHVQADVLRGLKLVHNLLLEKGDIVGCSHIDLERIALQIFDDEAQQVRRQTSSGTCTAHSDT